jgi:beta-aspartyl-dipeptidase (metallo-type)
VRTFHPTHCNRNPKLWAQAMRLGYEGLFVDVTGFPDDDSAARCIAEWLGSNPSERITLSSDGGGCLGRFASDGLLLGMDVGSPAVLLKTLRELGDEVPLERALATCTSNPADLFRLRGKGRLVSGADADLVVLDSGLRPRAVMAGGRWMLIDGEPRVRGLFERSG